MQDGGEKKAFKWHQKLRKAQFFALPRLREKQKSNRVSLGERKNTSDSCPFFTIIVLFLALDTSYIRFSCSQTSPLHYTLVLSIIKM